MEISVDAFFSVEFYFTIYVWKCSNGYAYNYTFVLYIFNFKQLHQMKFKASIDVMPLEALLDPQGKAVTQSMSNLGLNEISNVRIGKHITLYVDADNENDAKDYIDQACGKLLCNKIMESYSFSLEEI